MSTPSYLFKEENIKIFFDPAGLAYWTVLSASSNYNSSSSQYFYVQDFVFSYSYNSSFLRTNYFRCAVDFQIKPIRKIYFISKSLRLGNNYSKKPCLKRVIAYLFSSWKMKWLILFNELKNWWDFCIIGFLFQINLFFSNKIFSTIF